LGPHVVPLATFTLLSLQTGDPVAQLSEPVWQAFIGVHDAPFVHMPHMPLEQTWPGPHPVPFG
jgi:hypothetical protein